MTDWREVLGLLRSIMEKEGVLIAVSALAGGLSRLISMSITGTSEKSLMLACGRIFIAFCIGVLSARLARHFGVAGDPLVGVAFVCAYLWQKIITALEGLDLRQIMDFIRNRTPKDPGDSAP